MRNAVTFAVVALGASLCIVAAPATAPTAPATNPTLTDNVLDAKGLDSALEKLKAPMRETDPLSPAESLKKFKPIPGLAVDLIAAEPDIRQPLCINFDERGRMWVVQYIQYPFPEGLKVVEYDRYIRAKFDKVPAAPPNHAAGKDVITILEDVDRDGSFRKHKTFVSGLSIATSALPGRGGRPRKEGVDYGVWVMNAPYLLFYPDADRDDVPDGDPIVHLSGFGLEDTHAVANNLTWGPDGWLYGCQGSTCTAKVKTLLGDTSKTTDFLGQAIWRYHPERHVFEIFAEGGGNTFGLEFDDAGRAFSGTNWGKFRGLHFVQGGYYVKGWGKHGPLTNPYAFGWFEHMPHEGNADRLSHTFVVYGGTLFPQYRGKIISPNSLQSRIQLSRLEPMGSTYKTVEEPYLVTSDDGWFRPVDLKIGPDGAMYVADFYEKRISHVDPRDTWGRGSGRIYRIRPADWKPTTVAMDLRTESTEKLRERLKSDNRWERAMARQVLGDKHSYSAASPTASIKYIEGHEALESLLVACRDQGNLTRPLLVDCMAHPDPQVRTWAVRLIADTESRILPDADLALLRDLASRETNSQVRSQLASSARRLRSDQSFLLVSSMLSRHEDAKDPHIPLLLWWDIERLAVPMAPAVAQLISRRDIASNPLVREVIAPRLARRYAADPTLENQEAIVRLFAATSTDSAKAVLASGVREALTGGSTLPNLTDSLRSALLGSSDAELGLILGDSAAIEKALAGAKDESASVSSRLRLINALRFVETPQSAMALVWIAQNTKSKEIRLAAINAVPPVANDSIPGGLVVVYERARSDSAAKLGVVAKMLSKPAWAERLLQGLQSNSVSRSDLSPADIERLRQFEDPAVAALVEKVFGKAVRATDAEKAAEVERIKRLATTGVGDAARGKTLFMTRCGVCHTLFNEGGKIGPDLTTYDRRNANDMAINIVDPSAYIREEFASFRIKTKGDEVYVGLIIERSGDRLTLVDAAQQKTTVAKGDIADERAMKQSLMPEGLMAGLSDQDVRDLFKYLAK